MVNKILYLNSLIPKKIYTKSGNKIYPLNVAGSGDSVLISNRKHKHRNIYIKNYLKVPKNRTCLYYYWPAGKNQNHSINNGIRCKYSLIPSFIPSDKLTFNALGLLQAEMTKHTKRASTIIFTNSDPNLINIVIRFLERLSISRNSLKWDITFNFKLKNVENEKETSKRESEALTFWLKNTLINKDKKHNKFIFYSGNKNYKNMRKDTIRMGSLRICYNNIIIYQLILNLLTSIDKIINNKKCLVWYMQGLIAGEGDIKLTKTKSIDSVRIGCVNLNEKRLYKKFLGRLGIKSQIEKNYISINNQRNFIKLYNYRLLDLHQRRYNKFINGLASYKYIKRDIKKDFDNVIKKIRGENGVC